MEYLRNILFNVTAVLIPVIISLSCPPVSSSIYLFLSRRFRPCNEIFYQGKVHTLIYVNLDVSVMRYFHRGWTLKWPFSFFPPFLFPCLIYLYLFPWKKPFG